VSNNVISRLKPSPSVRITGVKYATEYTLEALIKYIKQLVLLELDIYNYLADDLQYTDSPV
jgi:hypothetical protein